MSQKKESQMNNQVNDQKAGVDPAAKWREMAEQEAGLAVEKEELPLDEESVAALDEISKKKLTDITNQLEQEIDAYKSEALRAKAELENVRRRLERDVSNAHKYGSERLIVDLLPVIDSLVRGLEESQSAGDDVQSLRKGMELTLEMLHNILKKNGVTEINPQAGDVFDPTMHEAMSMRQDPNAKPNTILHVLQRGYLLHGRVVRAAMVMVAS